ncbi:MAG: lytic transglycosylase domain-containing protein [Syntrophomonadaceae bacterium]|nr:lytic transglycosylase domain-containing protein [Syntrophomonadaceae bacterium]
MKKNTKKRFSKSIWITILLFLILLLSFPQWISNFYPQPHSELIFQFAGEHNVDPYLVFAIIRAESKYETSAQSPVGARGLMQIMPETAAWIASQQGISEFDPLQLHDPELNISFGCWYLNNLNQEFDGKLPVVLAAYNAGRGKVKEWIVNEQWDGSTAELDKIPFDETREYVKSVLKNYEAYQAIYTE